MAGVSRPGNCRQRQLDHAGLGQGTPLHAFPKGRVLSQPTLTIRPAAPDDAAEIAAIIREAFPPRMVGVLIYGCPGIAKFIAEQIGVQERGGSAILRSRATLAASSAARNAASTEPPLPELHRGPSGVPRAGSGPDVCSAPCKSGRCRERGGLRLDVLDFNVRRMAVVPTPGASTSREHLLAAGFPWRPPKPAPVCLTGYAQAQACHCEYGFSQFSVFAAGRRYDVGRPGAEWYRLTDPAALTAPGVLAGLEAAGARAAAVAADQDERV